MILEARIDSAQLNNLNRDLDITGATLLNLATKVFKLSAKDFSKKVIKRANSECKISIKKLKERIKQYVISDLKIKIFNGFYRIGITNWNARQIGKISKGSRRNKNGRKGVEYGAPGQRRFRDNAFIISAKKKDGTAGGRIAFKRTTNKRLPIQKQVDDIDSVIEPILESETDNFYQIFAQRYDKECIKYLKR
jgi:hypothetical protein